MKKFLLVLGLMLIGLSVRAEFIEVESNINMENFWNKNGKDVQKIMEVGSKIINANKLEKRVPFQLVNNSKIINAGAFFKPKLVIVYTGLLPYIDNDDELAYVLGHEIAHTMDAYEGAGKWAAMLANVRSYEYKADLIGIDLMVKAGYNPIAAITETNKWMPEPLFDFISVHPKPSKRMFEMYKYIYVKYPWALNSDMAKNVNYTNFVYATQKEINQFILNEKVRENNKKSKYSL